MSDTTPNAPAPQEVMVAMQAHSAAVMDAVARRDYTAGEKAVADWEQYLNNVDTTLTPLMRGFFGCQMNNSGGNLWLSHAMYGYYITADFIESPPLFETAEGYFERAVQSLASVSIDPADTKLAALCQDTLALPRASLLDARGMKLMTQGEFELDAGGLLRAQTLLGDAVKAMRDAITARNLGANAATANDMAAPLFVDYAEANQHEGQSDQALLSGDLKAAAAAQGERADALDRAQAMHARVRPSFGETSPYFARRLARDAFVARRRQDRLLAAASAQPQTGWLRAVVFVVLALGALALFIGGDWYTHAGLMDNKFVVTTVVVYAFLVAGVGSRLAQWGDAADRLGRIMSAISGDKGGDKAQDKKS
jgi:hypothetical protein